MSTRGAVAVGATVFFVAAGAASAAVTAEFFLGTLSVSSDGADAIAVTCNGGMALVNGAAPEGEPAPCGAVEVIEIDGGPDGNSIDLSAVTPAAFPGAQSVLVSGNDGVDSITGSALSDDIGGERHDDTLRGGPGDDSLNGGEDDDSLFGGAGNDTLAADLGSDRLDGQGGSDTYQLDLSFLGSDVRVADTGAEGTDRIELSDCEGVVVEARRITYQEARVAVSGIESYPCGYTPPPAPPPPPPASARQPCVVPRLRGRTLRRAKVLIARAHCSVGRVTRVRSRAKRGVVVGQSPAAGLRRARGAKVALRISRGP